MIFDVQKCSKIQIFRGSAPDPTGGILLGLGELTLLPYNLFEGTRCDAAPFPITPPVLGLSIRSRFYGFQGQTHYKLSTANMIINAFLLAGLVFLILKRL